MWRGSPSSALLRLGYIALPRTGPEQLSAGLGVALAAEEARRDATRLGRRVVLVSGTASKAELPRVIATMAREGTLGFVGNGDREWSQSAASEAEAHRMVFVNIGCCDDALRAQCRRVAFHVQASHAMLLDALAEAFSAEGRLRWVIVGSDAPAVARAVRAVEQRGGTAVQTALAAEAEQENTASALRVDAADAVLLTGGSTPRAWRTDVGTSIEPVLWHAGVPGPGALELNERFSSHFRRPLDSAGWAGWAGVRMLWEAAAQATESSAAALRQQLRKSEFDGHKGTALSFRPWDHQLRQPLYLVQSATGTPTGSTAGGLDALGDSEATIPCALS